jgi:glutaredoxin
VIALTVYSRPGCHLCEEMKATIDRVARHVPLTMHVVDISADADLEARYGLEIPVLVVNGKKAAKYRISEEELLRLLRARSREVGWD